MCGECNWPLEKKEEKMEWISVKHRLPEKDGDYLTFSIDNGCTYRMDVQRFYTNGRVHKGMYSECLIRWEKQRGDDNIVTHWMVLPNPPKGNHE